MTKFGRFFRLSMLLIGMVAASRPGHAVDCEEVIAKYMVGQALLAAHFVAAAEKTGMKPAEIDEVLEDITAKSSSEEFWITDSKGHAYLTNTGIDFTFTANPGKQPQAAAFWPLIGDTMTVVTQPLCKRDYDERVFKYVGVAGVDKRRIVQVGVSAEKMMPTCK